MLAGVDRPRALTATPADDLVDQPIFLHVDAGRDEQHARWTLRGRIRITHRRHADCDRGLLLTAHALRDLSLAALRKG